MPTDFDGAYIFPWLFQQAKDLPGVLIRLGKHGLGRLGQDAAFRIAGHRLGHIGVADRALGAGDVFTGRRKVAGGKVHAGDHRTNMRVLASAVK